MVDRLAYVPPVAPASAWHTGGSVRFAEFPSATSGRRRRQQIGNPCPTALPSRPFLNPQPRTSHDQHPPTSQPLTSPHPLPNHPPFSCNPKFPNTIATGSVALAGARLSGPRDRRRAPWHG
jgi:hypothetical protein